MSSLHVKKGDKVLVLTKVRKGESQISKVLSVNPENSTVIVDNVRIATKHKKARSAKESGGKIKEPASINASNVMVICPSCDKPTRTGNSVSEGKKVRICKKCGAVVDIRAKRAEKKAAEKKAKATKETGKETPESTEKKTPAKKPKAESGENKEPVKTEVKTAEKKETATKKPAAPKTETAKKPAAAKAEGEEKAPAKKAAAKKPAAAEEKTEA